MLERTAILIAQVMADGPFSERPVRNRLAAVFDLPRTSSWPKRLFAFAKAHATEADGKFNEMELAQLLVRNCQIDGLSERVLRRIDQTARKVKSPRGLVPRMFPVSERAASWNVPEITTTGQLADFLKISTNELSWFADVGGDESGQGTERLRHYRYRWLAKASGGFRLLESPKPRLKEIQRLILHEILNRIPAHPCAHGFIKGRNCRTAAIIHVRREVVLKVDLRQFFPSIYSGRVVAVFRSAGYPQRVAEILAGLCTNTTSNSAFERRPLPPGITHRFHDPDTRHFLIPHLPQGSPTSPLLANLAAYRLDSRLQGLAGAFDARYTRYADDLVFSGGRELSRSVARARIWICAICLNEGFYIQRRKTTVQRKHQRQSVHGIVVNESPSVSRKERDALKAILHNCVRNGPEQNNRRNVPDFRAHLQGRIAAVAAVHSTHAQKLRTLYEQIDWTTTSGS